MYYIVIRGGQKTVEPDPPDKSGRPARPPVRPAKLKNSHTVKPDFSPLSFSLSPHGAPPYLTAQPPRLALTLTPSPSSPHGLTLTPSPRSDLPPPSSLASLRSASTCLASTHLALTRLAQISLTSSQPVGFVCRSVMVL
uniref:Uncharacterized protein n=1 Tax=Fagus sylvatica TaxID=28930 RepID=A0A2N9FG35_FAGSY